MKRTCENCSRPLFDTDTVCWHCGQRQSSTAPPEATSKQPSIDSTIEDASELELKPVASALILFYGGLTAVIILLLLLTLRSLGQSPIVTLNPDSSQGEWVSLNAPDKSFMVDIPAKWDWQFQEGTHARSSFTDMVENDSRIMTAVTPWVDLVPDTEYLLVARDGSDLLVVARSERLNRLSPQQAVVSLQQEQFGDIIVAEAQLIQGDAGEEKALFTLMHSETPLQCEQYLVPASSETYVVAACTLPERTDQQRREFKSALNSFSIQSR